MSTNRLLHLAQNLHGGQWGFVQSEGGTHFQTEFVLRAGGEILQRASDGSGSGGGLNDFDGLPRLRFGDAVLKFVRFGLRGDVPLKYRLRHDFRSDGRNFRHGEPRHDGGRCAGVGGEEIPVLRGVNPDLIRGCALPFRHGIRSADGFRRGGLPLFAAVRGVAEGMLDKTHTPSCV